MQQKIFFITDVEISEKLIVEQLTEFLECLSSVVFPPSNNDDEIISLSLAKIYVFSDFVSCLGKMNRNKHQKLLGKDSWIHSKIFHGTDFRKN